MFIKSLFAVVSCLITCTLALHIDLKTRSAACVPYRNFLQMSRPTSGNTDFVGITPERSYKMGPNGLELILEKPPGKITTKDGVNNKVAEGATVNSTFTLL